MSARPARLAALAERLRGLTGELPLLAGASLATLLASVPGLHAYRVGAAPLVVAAAAVVPVLIAFAVARVLGLGAPASYGASLGGLLLLLLVTDGPHPGVAWSDLVHGPNRVLTETLPLGGGRAALGPLVLLTWVGAAAMAELVSRRRARGAVPASALALPVGLYVLSYAAASAAPTHDRVAGAVLLGVLACLAVYRRHLAAPPSVAGGAARTGEADGRPSPYRLLGIGAVIAVTMSVVAALVVPSLPGLSKRPAAVRRRPPTLAAAVTDPVDALAALRDSGSGTRPVPILTDDVSAPSTGYLAAAVLDDYDGDLWRFSATFEPTGGRIPTAGPAAATTDRRVTEQIAMAPEQVVPLLPALDRPVQVSRLAVVTDAATGMLLPAHVGGAADYTVVSQAPDETLTHVPTADGIDAGSAAAADTELPANTTTDLATTLRFFSTLTGQRPAPTVAFLQALSSALHAEERRIDPALVPQDSPSTTTTPTTAAPKPGSKAAKAPPPAPTTTSTTIPVTAENVGGTSLSEVINSVTVTRAATPEQFATIFAMAARYLGVPARLVTGYRIAAGSDAAGVGAGRYQVTSRQAWAWVEVPVAGLGWVVVDPTPDIATGVATPPPEAVSAPSTTVPPRQTNALPQNQDSGAHALAPAARIHVAHPHPVPLWEKALLGLLLVVVVLALLGPGQAGLRRAWRRRRRRGNDPVERAVGAWLEMLDGLRRAGMKPGRGATTTEVAAEAGIHFGAEVEQPVAAVGAVADRAVFAPHQPPDRDLADQAWEQQRQVRRRIIQSLDGRQRARAAVLVGAGRREASRPDGR